MELFSYKMKKGSTDWLTTHTQNWTLIEEAQPIMPALFFSFFAVAFQF
jgi:hypothetical protein